MIQRPVFGLNKLCVREETLYLQFLGNKENYAYSTCTVGLLYSCKLLGVNQEIEFYVSQWLLNENKVAIVLDSFEPLSRE